MEDTEDTEEQDLKGSTSASSVTSVVESEGTSMHSDPAEVQKSVRGYMKVGALLLMFTGITVAASYFSLGVAAGITVALIIATMKGSMVAAVFMHLSHEKKWVYAALVLTVVGFLVLIFVPLFTVSDTIGTRIRVAAPAGGHLER